MLDFHQIGHRVFKILWRPTWLHHCLSWKQMILLKFHLFSSLWCNSLLLFVPTGVQAAEELLLPEGYFVCAAVQPGLQAEKDLGCSEQVHIKLTHTYSWVINESCSLCNFDRANFLELGLEFSTILCKSGLDRLALVENDLEPFFGTDNLFKLCLNRGGTVV